MPKQITYKKGGGQFRIILTAVLVSTAFLSATVAHGQLINYDRLGGTWYLYKATKGKNDNLSSYGYKYWSFKDDSTFVLESTSTHLIKDTIVDQKQTYNYSIDKMHNKIFFSHGVNDITYIGKDGGKRHEVLKAQDTELLIVSLDRTENLVLLLAENPDIDLYEMGDRILYFTKTQPK